MVMGELELEPDAELPEERLGGCTSAKKSRGGSPCKGSLMWRSSAMGESIMPHVRMWERLQSSHVHLLEGKKWLILIKYCDTDYIILSVELFSYSIFKKVVEVKSHKVK